MKKIYLGLFITGLLSAGNVQAQFDLALASPSGSIDAPVSGCGLSSTEQVSVTIFNFGPGTCNVPFDVTYTVTGPVNTGPITETVMLPNIPQNTSFTYTFSTTADFSVPGAYTVSATVTLATDPVAANNTFASYAVTNNSPSVGGTASPASVNVCVNSNSGAVTLAGHTGNVLNWEYSTDGGFTWFTISNTTTSQSYNNLSVQTWYRANVQNAGCAPASSSIAMILMDPVSVGGTITGANSVCSGSATNLTSTGITGTRNMWYFNNGGGWFPMGTAAAVVSTGPLLLTTQYRVEVTSGACPSVFSAIKTVAVNPPSVGGTLDMTVGNDTVCATGNAGTITVSGHTGAVNRWEFSTNSGVSWTNITNTTVNQTFSNLVADRWFRARIVSGACAAAYSDTMKIVVVGVSGGGSISTSTTVCNGLNADTLDLVGYVGNIINWEKSTDGGSTWNTIANTTDEEPYSNITQTTLYRAIVQNTGCTPTYSDTATLSIDAPAIGGSILGSTTVCASGNSGTLGLIGHNASVVDWEMSTDGGMSFSSIGNASPSQNYVNLVQSTIYRAIVSSGVCPNDTSSTATINVDAVTVGGSVTLDDTVCAGNSYDTLFLSGHLGTVLNWEVSNDGGVTFFTLSNTDTMQVYQNLIATSTFRARIQNGVCPSAGSSTATITVSPQSEGGVVNSNATGCEGFNSGIMALSGYTGNVVEWLSSTDGGTTWSSIANTTTSNNFSNLTDTTFFAAVVQSGACNADTATSAYVLIYPKPAASFTIGPLFTCEGVPNTFTNNTTVQGGALVINNWDFGDNSGAVISNPAHTYTSSGTFNVTLVAMSNFGCLDTATASVTVNAAPDPTITPSNSTIFCQGDSVILAGVNIINYAYDWSTGETTMTITVDTSGTFELLVTDMTTGCQDSSTVMVIAKPVPVADAGPDTTINIGSSYVMMGTGVGGYLWTPGSTLSDSTIATPIATPLVTTTYLFTVADANGCVDTASMTITVTENYVFNVPNLITPNGDGFNDMWIIDNIDKVDGEVVRIFNRNGQKIFEMTDYDNEWDGTFSGKVLPDGTYYYVIEFPDSDQPQKGAINVLSSK